MKRKIVRLLFCLICIVVFTSCAVSPESAYEKASKSNSIKAYREFINNYPNSPLASKAQTRIYELINELYVEGVRQICYAEGSGEPLSPWDKILQDDNANVIALAMKGIAAAKKHDLGAAKARFAECSRAANDTQLAPYILLFSAVKDMRAVQLACPLPASIAKRAVLDKSNQSIMKDQFLYIDPSASSLPIALLGGQARVFLWKVPEGSTKDIISKIMNENIRQLE